ncbi:2-phosphosulfolactate phosphatase [Ignavibacterium sp.]|uniref:2-phosphosulfolactate phosphatase n=1 Tax=Ignavibacterium sp. TaxID=2651167 RepID=UPI0022069125|nr:2-phosphosulfolactate phosphatase [Ignavibacterium sp.]BDQ04129.1 MAG: putative 2-phosphosulfolactate phosphatase [Ignavibacterium sp.]
MKVNVLFSPIVADELYFTGKTTVVIDVLRASSTIITALNNGAKEVVPVGTIEFAVKVSGGMFGGQTLLGGERNTKKIEGFALGNSPLEYEEKIVNGKSIVFYTTNGTKALTKAKFSENLFVCSFLNLSTVAKHLVSLKKNVEIICAGRNNFFSLEDTVCAGKLVSEILSLEPEVEINDSVAASLALNDKYGSDLLKMLNESDHGKLLLENGFEEDINYCSQLNIYNTIPYYVNGVLKLMKEID